MSKQAVIPFKGTAEQEKELMQVIAEHKGQEGALIPVLHKAQEIYGYLPIEVQTMIAEGLDVTLAEVYGVVTFYTQFSLNPKGEHKIAVCWKARCFAISFSTPSIEGTVLCRNKPDASGKHPWKAEVTEGDKGVTETVIADWYKSVYEPSYEVASAQAG